MIVQSWIATGDERNWKLGLDHGVWGVRHVLEGAWSRLNIGDRVFFHVTAPISRTVGFGRVRTKFRQLTPLWFDEVIEQRVIYPFRFEFDVETLLPADQWRARGINASARRLPIIAGLNQIGSEATADQLAVELRQVELPQDKAPSEVPVASAAVREATPHVTHPAELPEHRDIQAKLLEIGRVQRFIAEAEYPIESGRLDVVWRRMINSVPTYAFEVQVSGEVSSALAKLKYAHQIWNSKVFIVSKDKSDARVEAYVRGPLHELRDVLRPITHDEVRELHGLKARLSEFERTLGLL